LIEEVGGSAGALPPPPAPGQAAQPQTAPPPSAQAIETLKSIRNHLQRYRELSSQGKWAEAGKELDEIQGLVQK
jgi:hypothetical protein